MKPLATALFLLLLLIPPFPGAAGPPPSGGASSEVRVVRIADVIGPVVAEFVVAEIDRVNASGGRAFLLELDTPGGLDTAMRTIIQGILGSRVPVIVYIFPAGARAASAGALITLSADFAAMAPGTNLGAAHPVAIGPGGGGDETMTTKVVNDAVAYARSLAEERGRNVDWAERIVRESVSTSASEALGLKVIDLIAKDESSLLVDLDGRKYRRDGKTLILKTTDVTLVPAEMGWREKILAVISNPNVAYLLLMLGILGIFFEISQPGVILPGAIGAIALLLALFAFQTLTVNYAGVLLILLAIVLFILEVKVASYGMLSVGGIIALALGSLMLIESTDPGFRISPILIAVTVAVCSGFFLLVLTFVIRTQRRRFVSGGEGMVGERGTAMTAVGENGRVFVHGEYWDAWSKTPIAEGEGVEVVRLEEGMRLEVRPVEETNRKSGA